MTVAYERLLHVQREATKVSTRAARLAWEQLWEDRRAFTLTADASSGPGWRGSLTVQNSVTPDKRMIAEDSLDHRELPLPLMAMFENGPGGHEGSRLAGRIDSITQNGDDFVGEGVIDAGGETGAELLRLREAGMPLGISVDLAIHEHEMRAADDPFGAALAEEEAMEAFFTKSGVLVITKATILGATVVPMQAIDEANEIEILAVDAAGLPSVIRAHGGFLHTEEVVGYRRTGVITASAYKRPSIAAFQVPEADEAMPLQYPGDGTLFGHLAPWDCCHVGWTVCTPPPRSSCNYAYFHTGAMTTAEGEPVAVGKLVFSMNGGKHAPDSMSAQEAAEYYDDYTKCAGYAVAQDGEHGIWLSGVERAGLTEEERDFLRLHPPSGDWRPIRGFGESQLIAGFSVTIGGYPMPQSRMVLTASGAMPEEMGTLIITPGWMDAEPDETELARMMRVLAARAHGPEALAALARSL